jgi:hypothetical protein
MTTRRKGELTRSRLDGEWPHHVALPAERVRGLGNSDEVRGFASTLSVAPLTYSLRHERGDQVVFCFAKPEDAQAFADRFGGERIDPGGRR